MDNNFAVTIRQMDIADIEPVISIDHLSFNMPWPRSSFKYELTENKNSRHWVAEIQNENGQNQIVGILICWFIIDEAHVGTLAVHPEFRRHSIGEKLMRQALEEFKAEGALKALLEVRRSNEAAIHLYRKLGFIEDGIRRRYYKDNNEDAILMELPNLGQFTYQEPNDGSI